jgi:hypothetical protein
MKKIGGIFGGGNKKKQEKEAPAAKEPAEAPKKNNLWPF